MNDFESWRLSGADIHKLKVSFANLLGTPSAVWHATEACAAKKGCHTSNR